MNDIIIIGGGVAGMTAAIYAARAGKKVLVIEGEAIGGQIASSPMVANFPSYASISGLELVDKIFDQCNSFGVEFEFEKVVGVDFSTAEKKVFTENGEFLAKGVIIATGLTHRRLNLKDEDKYLEKGISYCVMCDGNFYAGKDVGVVGGGNSAIISALYLANICRSVSIFQNLNMLTAEKTMLESLEKTKNVKVYLNAEVKAYLGEEHLEGVRVMSEKEEKDISLDGLFLAIGKQPSSEAFADVVYTDENGYFLSNENCDTKVAGVYVAGDCRVKGVRQLTTAVADGTAAAINLCKYLEENL